MTYTNNYSPETKIKALLIEHLRNKKFIGHNDVLINEFALDNHSRRADFVVCKKDKLFAYEIKSKADSLYRLSDQVKKYIDFFDKTIVVADKSHISKILQLLPKEVAVWEVSDNAIKVMRQGKIQPKQNKKTFLKLMHAHEISALLKEKQIITSDQKRKNIEQKAIKLSLTQLRKASINAVRKRYSPYSEKFLKQVLRTSQVCAADISLLSPYLEKRKINHRIERRQETFWEKWKEKITATPDDPFLFQLNKESATPIFGKTPENIENTLMA